MQPTDTRTIEVTVTAFITIPADAKPIVDALGETCGYELPNGTEVTPAFAVSAVNRQDDEFMVADDPHFAKLGIELVEYKSIRLADITNA
jgi:hypothetical protein